MRIMIAGGGTGGHISPALAVIEELQSRDPRLMLQWLGRRGGREERLCSQLAIPFRSVSVEGWPRKRSLRKAWAGAKLVWAIAKSWMLIKRFQPQAVFGVGGYISLPVVYAAQRLALPTVIHEQNRRLGLANHLLARKATRILLSYPDTEGDFERDKAIIVGNPVRAAFRQPPSRERGRAVFQLDETIPVVLIVGGSQGARTLNEAVSEALPHLREKEVQILWMTGSAEAEAARAAARNAKVPAQVFAFIEDMASACAAADLIVSRAGASATAEIAAMGKPSVLVPYPYATDNHQEQNARLFEEVGAARVLLDHECNGERLLDTIREFLPDSARLKTMGAAAASLARLDAAERIVEEIFSLVFE